MLLCQLHLFQLKFLHSCSGKDNGFLFLAPQVCLVYALHNFLGLKPIYTFKFAIILEHPFLFKKNLKLSKRTKQNEVLFVFKFSSKWAFSGKV